MGTLKGATGYAETEFCPDSTYRISKSQSASHGSKNSTLYSQQRAKQKYEGQI